MSYKVTHCAGHISSLVVDRVIEVPVLPLLRLTCAKSYRRFYLSTLLTMSQFLSKGFNDFVVYSKYGLQNVDASVN